MEAEKNDSKIQLQKIDDYNRELITLQNKFTTTEKENEVLIQKLAVVSMKFADAEKKINKKVQFFKKCSFI